MDLKNQTQKRTIKFRGLRTDAKGFAFGSLILPNPDNKNTYIQGWNGTRFKVIPTSISQFTGLHDKNGKEIYEGDIILFQKFSNWDDDSMKRHKATVIFKEGCFMWEILEFGKKSVTYYANATEPLRNTNSIWGLEVIGNIYENQELLENKLVD